MNCARCDDTGSLSKNDWGHLDCVHCDVAEERMRVESWARRATPHASPVDVWKIYQRGKAAGGAPVARSAA
jgi:hypothetical protein